MAPGGAPSPGGGGCPASLNKNRSRTMKSPTAMAIAPASAIVLILWGTAMPARAEPGYEQEPVLNAKDLAAPERLSGRIELGTERVYQAATAPDQSGGERAAEASKRVGMATITALGFEKERRDLAKSLGVDPYTTNEVLSEKLTDAAWVAFSGRFIIQTATSILVPYSMAMSAVTITNSSIYDTPPGDLINNATMIFASTGASDAQVQGLVQNKQYTLTVLTELALAIQRLQGVQGLD